MIRAETVRADTTCPGCNGPKDAGCLVCWQCFKYRPHPFKYFVSAPEASEEEAVKEWVNAVRTNTYAERSEANRQSWDNTHAAR